MNSFLKRVTGGVGGGGIRYKTLKKLQKERKLPRQCPEREN
jgi:hypothetical protein